MARPRLRKRSIVGVAILAIAIGLAYRHELIPTRFSPLPAIDLDQPAGWFVDWQLASLRQDRSACRRLLASPTITATQIADQPMRNGCGVQNGVRVSQVGGARLPIGRIRCEVAIALAIWLQHDVQPLARELLGKRVTAVRQMGGYSCRNIRSTNPLFKGVRSQHAIGSAIDLGGFRLSNGRWITVARHWSPAGTPEARFLRAVHARACRYFRVALGPEFNRLHRDHFHFDRGPLWTCR